jgi:uncharacterized protein (DUF433 family)
MRNKATTPIDTPAYTLGQAAHYLGLPYSTVKTWVIGQHYETEGSRKFLKPVIQPADRERNLLSFRNMVELHVLSLTRREFNIPMHKVRVAVEYLKRTENTSNPLSDIVIHTDRVDLFVERMGEFVSASRGGQLALRALLDLYLKRVDRDKQGLPLRLYPFTRKGPVEVQPKMVVIDPELAFGRLAVADLGVSTRMIADRLKQGESIQDLMDDYGCSAAVIEEAIRCEMMHSDAA